MADSFDMTQILRQELARRIDRNPRYSMRAFAQSLGINIGSLSSIISGKRPLTVKTAQRLLDSLNMSPQDIEPILNSIAA